MSLLEHLLIPLLTRVFRKTALPTGLAEALAADAVLVTQAKSFVIQALLNSFAQRLDCKTVIYASAAPTAPEPQARIKQLRWICVHDRHGLEHLTKLNQKQTFSTLSIFFARGPLRSNPSHRINAIRQCVLMLRARHIAPVASAPLLAEGLSTGSLQRLLKVDFYRTLKLIRGTPLQPLDAQMRAILAGAEFERELNIVAARARVPKEKLFAQAQREFLLMAANPRLSVFWLLAPLARFIIRRLFAAVRVEGLKDLTSAVRENTVVLVPMHRSHLDYIIVGSTLYDSGINPPLVAAGVNLNFWPVGFFIRSVGAYFVKRNAKTDRLHALLLRRYVTYLIKRGHLQEFFIEGGRSRSGRMRPPKVGLLSIMTDAYMKGLRRDILFVPVSITYETVVEDKVYGDENTGRRKLKENALSLVQASKIFHKSYGDVILHFGTPLSVAAFREQHTNRAAEEDRSLVIELAHELTRSIRQQSHVSLTSLAATALLLAPRYALPRKLLVAQIRALALAIERMRRFDSSTSPFTPSLVHFLEGKEHILDDLTRSGFVALQSCLGQDVFVIPGQRRFTADFYKNSCSHVFSELAFISVLSLLDCTLESPEAVALYKLCFHELLLPAQQRFFARLNNLVESLRVEQELDSHTLQFASSESPLFVPGILLSQLQSLHWVHLNLAHAMAEAGDSKELAYNAFIESLQSTSKTALYLGQLSRSEATSQASLVSAIDGLQQRGLVTIVDSGGKPGIIKITGDLAQERIFVNILNSRIMSELAKRALRPQQDFETTEDS